MIRIRMGRVEGLEGMGDELLRDLEKKAPRAVRAGRAVAVAEFRRLLTLRSGGPAPAGQPPAKVEGDLLRSIKLPAVRKRGREYMGAIHVDHEGANRLEHGFRDRRGIATHPHPFADPAIANKAGEIQRAMEEALS